MDQNAAGFGVAMIRIAMDSVLEFGLLALFTVYLKRMTGIDAWAIGSIMVWDHRYFVGAFLSVYMGAVVARMAYPMGWDPTFKLDHEPWWRTANFYLKHNNTAASECASCAVESCGLD